MKKIIVKKHVVFCFFLLLCYYSKAQFQPRNWSINISPLMNLKGKCTPDAPYTKKLSTFSAASLQFGINRYCHFRNASYLNLGLQYGWVNVKAYTGEFLTSEYPELKKDVHDGLGTSFPFFFSYSTLSASYHWLLKRLPENQLYIGTGAALRLSTNIGWSGSAMATATSVTGDTIPLYSMEFWNDPNKVTPDLLLSISDKILINEKHWLLVEVTARYSLSYMVKGVYEYFPETASRATGTYKVSGSYIAITLGYLFSFQRDRNTKGSKQQSPLNNGNGNAR